jgi:hypothetical protein
VRFEPISSQRLVQALAELIFTRTGEGWLRVGIDGPVAVRPEAIAAALVEPLAAQGHKAMVVPLSGFVRPASIRFEQGRTNPDSFYENWYDLGAVQREVLDPLEPGGSGRVLPSLWDTRTDRATRAGYQLLPPGGVLLLGGPLLLGAGLALDLTAHLLVTPAALGRLTPPGELWTLPAYQRYADEVGPEAFADVVVRYDDPSRPAIRAAG